MILGARLTYAAADADRVEDPSNPASPLSVEDDWKSLTGSARVVWKPDESLRFFGGISQAFHAPDLNDLTRAGTVLSGEIEVPSSGLDPEGFLSFEAGAKVKSGTVLAEISYFFTLIDGLIIRQPTGMMSGPSIIVTKTNSGDGHVQGIEFSSRWALADQWTLIAGGAWTDGQVEGFPTSAPVSKTEPLTRLAPLQGRIALRWETGDGVFWVEPSVRVVDAQDRLSSSDGQDTQRIPPGGSPGFTIWSLDAGVRLGERASLFLSVENLGDKNYRTHGSGVQEPRLNTMVGLDVTF